MTDEFIIEEEEGGSSRTFLVLAGILATTLILATICTLGVLLSGRSPEQGNAEQIAAIETQNAIVAVTNAAVTATIAAIETEQARPTDTPTPTVTSSPVPTDTPAPTDTPVLAQVDEEATDIAQLTEEAATVAAEDAAEGTPVVSGTSVFGAGGNATVTPISGLGAGTAGGSEQLPQTGLDTWNALILAFVLLAALVAARRLRSA